MYRLQQQEISVPFAGGAWNQGQGTKEPENASIHSVKIPYFSFLGKRMEFFLKKLLYKIDLILFGGHCCYCFEMPVKMTLVKKTAFQGNL